MATEVQEETCDKLSNLIHKDEDILQHTVESVKAHNVGMDEDGHLIYLDTARASGKQQTRARLSRRRKELVLGLHGHAQHSIEEANEIIEEQWHDRDTRSGLFGRAKSFISL
jgi:hypothetical protein